MPKLSQQATVEVTQQVKLAPGIRKKMLQKFQLYQNLCTQKKALEHAMEKVKAEIADLRTEQGVESISLDGFTATLVCPTRKKFNEKLFIANGGNIDIYKGAIEEKPSKSYEKISVPGDTDEGDAE